MARTKSPLEVMVNSSPAFWRQKKVLLTGHTGFKGSWLAIYLHSMGAKVLGYSLPAPSKPSLFEVCALDKKIQSHIGDIRNYNELYETVKKFEPEFVFHLAAQALVRPSYENPLETYSTNVMGTANVLETCRKVDSIQTIINVTSDKCYENNETGQLYKETDRLGGYDPYSNSKACAELVASAYRSSFFNNLPNKALASVRAGNIIGGGDWAHARLIPDCIQSLQDKKTIVIRNPKAIRPWQHVLEPVFGYTLLAERLSQDPKKYSGAWNFGPEEASCRNVEEVVGKIIKSWGSGSFSVTPSELHEAQTLKLDSTKAKTSLGWQPRWNLDKTVFVLADWYQRYYKNEDMDKITLKQIEDYEKSI